MATETNIIYLNKIDSTNKYAKKLLKDKTTRFPLVVIANEQTAGKGHAQNIWESDKDMNITLSIATTPHFVKAEQQFMISKAVSLGICDTLNYFVKGASIKWPNDIYIDNKKIAGILIENTIIQDSIKYSVIGIGLNVNQKIFNDNIPNPTSLGIITGEKIDLTQLIYIVTDNVLNRLQDLKKESKEIDNQYLDKLYGFNKFLNFNDKTNIINAQIIGVSEFGQLILETKAGEQKTYNFKEIEFIF